MFSRNVTWDYSDCDWLVQFFVTYTPDVVDCGHVISTGFRGKGWNWGFIATQSPTTKHCHRHGRTRLLHNAQGGELLTSQDFTVAVIQWGVVCFLKAPARNWRRLWSDECHTTQSRSTVRTYSQIEKRRLINCAFGTIKWWEASSKYFPRA